MADQEAGRSGPPVVTAALERIPGRPGELAAGAASELRGERFVGLVAEISFFVGAGLAPLTVAALALLGAFQPALAPDSAMRIDSVFIGAIMRVLEGDVAASAFADIQRLLNAGLSGVLVPLGIGVLFSARGFSGAMRGLMHLRGSIGHRPLWVDALATLAFTVGAAFLAAVGAVGALLGPIGGDPAEVFDVVVWLRWTAIPVGLLLWLTSLYRYCRGQHAQAWKEELPGAVVASVGIIISGLVYGIYLRTTPELGLGPFLGPVVGAVLATFSLVFAFAASVVVGGAVNAYRSRSTR